MSFKARLGTSMSKQRLGLEELHIPERMVFANARDLGFPTVALQ
jgi:hypothetical protein